MSPSHLNELRQQLRLPLYSAKQLLLDHISRVFCKYYLWDLSEHTSLILIYTYVLMTPIVLAFLLVSYTNGKLNPICPLIGVMSSTEQGHSRWQCVVGVAMVAVVVKRENPLAQNTKNQ
jgi:hypothetical protein